MTIQMKPFDSDTIKSVVSQAIEPQVSQNKKLKKRINVKFDRLIGSEKEMRRLVGLVKLIAKSDVTVLITGESGTGKSLFAKSIHRNSARKNKPYVEVLCGAIPESLLESEMFGYTKGSFTGAEKDKPGMFEMAEGGTILLDEIYSASASIQIKLLRVLQDKKYNRIGSNESKQADVRVIVATNSDLRSEVKKGNFRQDLYYRINVMHINIPPLRERMCDIKLLTKYFLDKFCHIYKKEKLIISKEAMFELQNYSWPGNVRELENVIQRTVIVAGGTHINVDDLSNEENEYAQGHDEIGKFSLKKAMEKPEKEIIVRTLRYFNGNKSKTAEILRLNRTTLYKKMRKYNM